MKYIAATIAIALVALSREASCETPGVEGGFHVIRKVYPTYPYAARDQQLEGPGLLRLSVRPDGTVRSVAILKSTGHALLDDAAVAAFRQWRFTPGAAREVKMPVNFTMKGVAIPRSH